MTDPTLLALKNTRIKQERRYSSARSNLLLVVLFTLINCVICSFGGMTYFLFSAAAPYSLAMEGAVLSGRFSDDVYIELVGAPKSELMLESTSYFVFMLSIAAVILVLFFLCWLLSGNGRVGWMIAGLVLFAADTVYMFLSYGFSVDQILDILFHIWVLASLIMGVVAHFKLKKLPEIPVEEPAFTEADPAVAETPKTE